MNYIKPEDIKTYVEQNPTGIAGMSEELAVMVNHFAELIVRECLICCERTISDPVPKSVDTFEQGGIHCIDEIKHHFGVGMTTEDKKALIKELLGVKNDRR